MLGLSSRRFSKVCLVHVLYLSVIVENEGHKLDGKEN